MPEQPEWLKQEEVANLLNVPLTKVRPIVAALHRIEQIETRVDPKDTRYLLIHRKSLPLLERALGAKR